MRVALVGLGLFGVAQASADVRLPAVVSSNMVLQQQTDAPIWGWAKPGEQVTVNASWGGDPVAVTANDHGRWLVRLHTPDAADNSGPFTITIAGNNTITLDNVLVGEVWVCSGQSNMEWSFRQGVDGGDRIVAEADVPGIRLFTVARTLSARPRTDCLGRWVQCSPHTVKSFSAIGYLFGRELHEELGVPIGLVHSSWGGTRAEAWMSDEALRAFDEYDSDLEYLELLRLPPNERAKRLKALGGDWWKRIAAMAPGGAKWIQSDYDDSKWKTTKLPATWAGDLASHDGLAFYRKVVDLPASWAGKNATIELGPIDDMDCVWINGTYVGGLHADGQWGVPRKYDVPATILKAGPNIIAIMALDNSGPGGINGKPDQMKLSAAGVKPVSLAGQWKYVRGPTVDRLPSRDGGGNMNQNTPTALYNGMIAPLTNLAIRGAIWYQGESNCRNNPELYDDIFPAMISDWRRAWGIGDFPFYFVQIAPYRYTGDSGQAATVREAQFKTLALPNTGMAVTMDIGNPGNIHPRNKKDVGHRLALWALARTYGRDGIAYSGPLYKAIAIEGSKIRVMFDHADGGSGGLTFGDGKPRHFLIAGADKQFHVADARIDGPTLVLSSDAVAKPVAVRYGWGAADEACLFNKAGLPASPFRSDHWTGPLPPVDNSAEIGAYRSNEPGFIDLFNGRDLAGWVNVNCDDSTWQVKDGVIKCSGIPTGVLRTDKQYQNFVLELEWRHLDAQGNAGVFIWSDPLTARGQPFTRSIEVQVMTGMEGSWFTSDGDVFAIHGSTMTPITKRGNASRAYPTEKRTNPSPLWNHYRITCKDGALDLAVNGKVVTRGKDCLPRKGYICLESEGSPIEFRNIRVKELPTNRMALPPEQVAHTARGFHPLYNGVDFDGWKFEPQHKGHWQAADWKIRFDGRGDHLWTADSYKDFELIADWRWSAKPWEAELPVILSDGSYKLDDAGQQVKVKVQEAGDSGIYLRGNSKSQVNIWCWPIGSGEVWGYRTDSSMPAEVRAAVTPSTNADAPIGQWNRFHITMKGDRLTVVLNGKTVIDNAQLPGVPAEGPIALQKHGGAIEFANIYIRELDD
jgi:sialate O-acetylesterase